MTALVAALTQAASGRGRVVAVAGEPGIGKSRVVAELSRVAGERRLPVLTGRAVPEVDGSALRPFAEALLVATRDLARPAEADLLPFLPALGSLLPHWRDDGWVAGAEPVVVLAEAVLRLLRHLAGGRALLLVLEDLHWADDATVRVVEFLADHCHEIPVVVCVTAREEEGHGPAVLAAVERAGSVVHRLRRLPPDDVHRMVRACTGAEPGRHADVIRAAEGLPLVVEDLLEGGLPRRFADSVRARTDQLTPAQARAVRVAALLGEQVEWPAVEQAAGAEASAALAAAIGLGLLVAEAGTVRFRHALTRGVIRDAIPPGERAALAAAAGTALLAVGPAVNPALPARLLRAATLLHEGGLAQRALVLLRRAATAADAAGDITQAEAALRAGYGIAHQHDPAAAPDLGRQLADVLLHAGRSDEAAELGAHLLAAVEGRDNGAEARVHVLLVRAHIAGGAWTAARAHLHQARELGAPAARLAAELAILETECAYGEDRAGQRAAVEHLAQAGVGLARTAGQPDLEAEALEQAGRIARMRDLHTAAASLRAALAVAAEHRLDYRRLQVLNELGTVEMLRDGRPDRLERARAEALRCGAYGLSTSAGLNLASAYAMTGRAADCINLAREVGATAGRLGQAPILAGCELIEGIAHAFTGDRDAAEAHLSRAEHLAPDDADLHAGAWGIGRGVGALVMEDRDGARRALQQARRAAPDRHARILDAALGPAMLLDALTGRTDPAEFDPLWEAMVRGARWHELWLGAAAAVATAHTGDTPAAEAALATALTAGGPYPLFGALVRRLVAEAAIQTGFTDPAPLLRDAETAFTTLDLPRPAAAVRGLLRGLGEAAPRRRRGDDPIDPHLLRLGVTAREAEVLHLLADRLTNRQIAERLYVSPKTVEKHVAALARKLDARDRVELAEQARTRRPDQAG